MPSGADGEIFSTEQRPGNLENICRAYWLQQGIPPATITSMLTQMTCEIETQLCAGKHPDEIIAPNPVAFSDHWARKYLYTQAITHMPSPHWRKLCYISIFLIGWLFTSLLAHLLWFSLVIPFSWVQLGVPILLVGIAHLTLFPELAPPVQSAPWREQTRLLAISVLLALGVLPVYFMLRLSADWEMSIRWPWLMTLLLTLCSVFSVRQLLREPYTTG